MTPSSEPGGSVCALRSCGRPLTWWKRLLSRGGTYVLNGEPLCGEACFRAQLRQLLDRSIRTEMELGDSPLRSKIGLILLDSKVINSLQLERALEIQRAGDSRRLGELVQQLGFATEQQVTVALSRQEGLPWLETQPPREDRRARPLVPPEVAVTSLIQPLEYDTIINELYVLSAAPVDRLALEALQQMNRCQVRVFIGPESQVRQAIARYHQEAGTPGDSQGAGTTDPPGQVLESICRFYKAASAARIEVARCRELLWMRAHGRHGRSDRFLLLHSRGGESAGSDVPGPAAAALKGLHATPPASPR